MTFTVGELKNMVIGIANVMDYAEKISQLPTCGNCIKAQSCEHIPPYGQPTRINCPLWSDKAEEKSE